jgi:hypothetical protein
LFGHVAEPHLAYPVIPLDDFYARARHSVFRKPSCHLVIVRAGCDE